MISGKDTKRILDPTQVDRGGGHTENSNRLSSSDETGSRLVSWVLFQLFNEFYDGSIRLAI